MIAIRKVCLFAIALFSFAPQSNAQQNMDVGLVINQSFQSKLAIEFRKPINDKYLLKFGVHGNNYKDWYENQPQLFAASNTVVVFRERRNQYSFIGLRFGGERILKSSIFSVGLDLNASYYKRSIRAFNKPRVYVDGRWSYGYFISEDDPDAMDDNPYAIVGLPLDANVDQNFLTTSLRGAFIMNLPIGKSFILSGSLSADFSTRFFLSEENLVDPLDELAYITSSSLNLNLNLGVGLRYIIGAKKD